MRRYELILGVSLWLSFVLIACTKEQTVPIQLSCRFEVENEDFTVPSRVKITNNTVGADGWQWSFEGGQPATSIDKNPGVIKFNSAGEYTVSLVASNQYGTQKDTTVQFRFYETILLDFDIEIVEDAYPPAEIKITNKCAGLTHFNWEFKGGQIDHYEGAQPPLIIYDSPGEFTITMNGTNGVESHSLSKTMTVLPHIKADFDWQVDFADDDYQAPVSIQLQNKSISAKHYQWDFTGAEIVSSTEEAPKVKFPVAGKVAIRLVADNGKEQHEVTKSFEVYEDSNLRIFKDVKLGINSAHSSIGCFYSTSTRQVYSKGQVDDFTGSDIDLAYFGLNSNFSFNQFVSPHRVQTTVFDPIPNAKQTIVVNRQDNDPLVDFTGSDFDQMVNDEPLKLLTIRDTDGGRKEFTSAGLPHIVLFQTSEGRKGAIKVKACVEQGAESYILCDIKVQKAAK